MLLAISEKPRARLRDWLQLTKPGIVLGNLISFAGGFLLASKGHPDLARLAQSGLGIALAMASGCVINNYIDRDIDARMARTRGRALITGCIAPTWAVAFGTLLGVLGFALLALHGSELLVAVVLIGYLNYVVAYSIYWKRSSVHGTLIGTLSGATAPVAGYVAVSGSFDFEALLLWLIFGLWQMPHAYAIAVSRLRDYTAAGIPVLPVQRGLRATRRHIVAFTVGFVVAALALAWFGYVGWLYGGVMLVLGAQWLRMACARVQGTDGRVWARSLFHHSLLVVVALNVMMAIDYTKGRASDSASRAAQPVPAGPVKLTRNE